VSPAALSRGYVLFTAAGTVGAVDLTTERVAWRRRLAFRAGATLGGHGLVWVHSSAIPSAATVSRAYASRPAAS
jgi:hypothetical protein